MERGWPWPPGVFRRREFKQVIAAGGEPLVEEPGRHEQGGSVYAACHWPHEGKETRR